MNYNKDAIHEKFLRENPRYCRNLKKERTLREKVVSRSESRRQKKILKYLEMYEHRKAGRTLEEIGELYGVTREAIRQHLTKFPRVKRISRRKEYTFLCKQCGKSGKNYLINRIFCNRICHEVFFKTPYDTPEKRRERDRLRMKVYYRSSPERKKKIYMMSRRYAKAHPEKTREWARKAYYKMKADPVKWAKNLERFRVYNKKRYGKLKLLNT